jgi:hypothetical protein
MDVKFTAEDEQIIREQTLALEAPFRTLITNMLADKADPRLVLSASANAVLDLVALMEIAKPGEFLKFQFHVLRGFQEATLRHLEAAENKRQNRIVRPF